MRGPYSTPITPLTGSLFHADPQLAAAYLQAGGLTRALDGAAIVAGSAPGASPTPTPVANVKWSDEATLEAEYVERRLREVRAQLRNPAHVREMKMLYGNECFACGRKVIVGVDPNAFYSEAAHIKPLGLPHNGPDTKNNMILLCPEHHLQFDRGILRLRPSKGSLVIDSRIIGDPNHGRAVVLKDPHVLDPAMVSWHFDFWKPI